MTVYFEAPLNDSEFHKFRKLIYSVAGISLSDRKRELVKSRLARRLRALNLTSYSEYYDLLCDPKRSESEMQQFTNCLTTNKTEFYRESHHFDFLRDKFLPSLKQAANNGRERKVRIWCAASSTGQEPYTLAITLLEFFGINTDWDLRLLASDIDTQVLATASEGIYPESDIDPIPALLRQRYLTRISRGENAQYQVNEEAKKLITFRQLNLNHPQWAINVKFDAIFCRNVMIYFDQPTQQRLVERFAQLLHPEGVLVIGHSESLFSISDQFDSLGDTIYRLKPGVGKPMASTPSAQTPSAQTPRTSSTTPRAKETSSVPSSVASRSATSPERLPAALTRKSSFASVAMKAPQTSPTSPAQSAPPAGPPSHLPSYPLIVGEYQASNRECVLRTTLGSCVAACILDSVNRIGGMNHFMLPESLMDDRVSASYGVHAMELLINAMMKLGANRRNLSAKIFGGAHVVDSLQRETDVGDRNVAFVRRFLDTENIPVIAEHVGGNLARQIKLIPTTGKVYVQLLDSRISVDVDVEQRRVGTKVVYESTRPRNESVTLFQ